MKLTVLCSLILIAILRINPALAYEVDISDFEVHCPVSNRSIPVYAYYPKVASKKQQFPLIIHIHGYGGTGDGSTRLNTEIAAAGYVILSPSMVDLYQGERINGKLGELIRNGTLDHARGPNNKRDWFDHKANGGIQRVQEARWLLDYFTNPNSPVPEAFRGQYNINNVAMSGHSFGGYTTLGVAGVAEHPSAKNLKAILLYSPGPGIWTPDDYQGITVPMMMQWGDEELNKDEESICCYENCAGPSFMAILKDTGHFAWSDHLFLFKRLPAQVKANRIFNTITRLSLDFFDGYLKNDKAALNRLRTEQAGLTRYEYRNL